MQAFLAGLAGLAGLAVAGAGAEVAALAACDALRQTDVSCIILLQVAPK